MKSTHNGVKRGGEFPKLSRAEAIDMFSKVYGFDILQVATGVRVRAEDHEGNSIAPERWCYKITFTHNGVKHRFGFWPNTVGYQGY